MMKCLVGLIVVIVMALEEIVVEGAVMVEVTM
jgi:hypothetical protein